MMQTWLKRFGLLLMAIVIAAGFYQALKEQPVGVDLAVVERAPMNVSIREEGSTRVRDIYTVSSPIAGNLERIELDEGDPVSANSTVIASIRPLQSPFINQRTELELKSAVKAAQSAIALALVEHGRSKVALRLAQSEYDRAATLSKKQLVPLSQLEQLYNGLQLKKAEVERAKASIELRKAELAAVQARLQPPGAEQEVRPESCCVRITAPIDGIVLKILARSEQAVVPGSRLVEVGDAGKMEVVVDLLSSDAARIAPGIEVKLSDWGGARELIGVVRRVEPAAFTKTSSLGIEEQRVNVVVDLEDIPPGLGHGYRVLAQLVVWSGDDILQLPIGALFRAGGHWAVFLVNKDGDRVEQHRVEIGQLNAQTAQILSGLSAGDQVVLYPNDILDNGSLIVAR